MKSVVIALGFLLIVGLGIGGTLFVMYQSLHDNAITQENEIQKKNSQTENILSTVTISIQEVAGVASMYAGDIKEIVKATFEGRYGADGSQAAIQLIKEQNQNLDPKLYIKIQDVIEGGRKEFQIAQDRKLEVCTIYRTNLDYLVRGALLRMAGFPKKDIEKLCQVVSDVRTQDAFEKGVQEPIKFGS